ncbi:amino acid ABC transporter substrate-binding protein, PAAT family [Psychromonas ingrahamii 37]|uniref:Amino acid ABC transporter substrate-binding protein, PAAT family n=1 Tax=Psychromonas ingrahamii (strain DSM 17664 / CCUG 51855 / 37) TaxID=357804 RepID=A1SW27_PSYIN|nr:amino acid ABC transporter substrate-binding protein [Psychromonas ingrahamii]ABM03692.1 amino acid ABC transporter substrate-binding protein, PAAT family [Psychromonas ingrahamii 37]
MKHPIKLIIAAAVAVSSLITVPAFAKETVKVGMSGNYVPFTFSEKDVLQGFEVDLWNEIALRADYDVKFVLSSFSGLFGMLEAGHIDTISNQITITPARLEQYAFTTPYVVDGVQIVTKKGREDINSVADLKGKKVAVNLGSNFEETLRALDPKQEIDIITYDTGFVQDVVIGRTDAFIMDRVGSAALIKKSGLPLKLAGQPFEKIENAMPFLNKPEQLAIRDKVNAALLSMKNDGTLAKISVKWLGSDVTQ